MTEERAPYQTTRAATSKPPDDQQTERLVIHCTPETLAKLKDIEQQTGHTAADLLEVVVRDVWDFTVKSHKRHGNVVPSLWSDQK
jgi:hypothetical protein